MHLATCVYIMMKMTLFAYTILNYSTDVCFQAKSAPSYFAYVPSLSCTQTFSIKILILYNRAFKSLYRYAPNWFPTPLADKVPGHWYSDLNVVLY